MFILCDVWFTSESLSSSCLHSCLLQKRRFFRIKNKDRGHLMSIQGGAEELRSGRVVVTPEVEPMCDVWFYQDGLIKNKVL